MYSDTNLAAAKDYTNNTAKQTLKSANSYMNQRTEQAKNHAVARANAQINLHW